MWASQVCDHVEFCYCCCDHAISKRRLASHSQSVSTLRPRWSCEFNTRVSNIREKDIRKYSPHSKTFINKTKCKSCIAAMELKARVLVLVCVVPLIATWQVNTQSVDNTLIRSEALQDTAPPPLSQHITDFGLQLQSALIDLHPHTNVVLSPASVAGVLAMALLGSVGETHRELVKALGFPSDTNMKRNNHYFFGEQLYNLNVNTSSNTSYANAIFVDKNAHLRDIYHEFVDRVYHSSIRNLDFSESVKALDAVNEWVRQNTNNKIQQLLKEPLPMDTQIVLASAIYFSGQWETPFHPEFTKIMPFQKEGTGENNEVSAELMLNTGKFRFARSVIYECDLLVLPYNDSITTFYAIKPRFPKSKPLQQLLKELDSEKIEQLIQEATLQNVVVRLPKMNLTSGTNLRLPLEALGINTLFTQEANFALMVEGYNNSREQPLNIEEDVIATRISDSRLDSLPNPGIYVDSVIHDVAITVNEYGTEAVAATAGVFARTAERFIADSPFFFFIRNERTKLITFTAAVYDPTST